MKSDFRFVSTLSALTFSIFILAQAPAAHFKVGYAERDVTPQASVPMWGYGGMGPRLSRGTFDPLYAKCVVIDVGDHKLALMGLDIGRGPRASSMERIKEEIKKTSGVDFVMISGSHTHHGPVTELTDEEMRGKGKYDDAVAYAIELEEKIIAAINEAAANVKDAKRGLASAEVPLCRNRHTKYQPKPIEDELTVIRFDDMSDKPIAILVNFSAHPTIISAMLREFSAEYPGQMREFVTAATGAPSIFLQGSAGDLSPNTSEITWKIAEEMKAADLKAKEAGKPVDENRLKYEDLYKIRAFGKQLADEVLKVNETIKTEVPASPSLQGMDKEYDMEMRIDIDDPKIKGMFKIAFFAELVENFGAELQGQKIHPVMTAVLLNNDLAFIGGSGEFFSNHSNRLKERLRTKAIFIGYCNGHHMYFPTIEGAAEGGYGADDQVSWVPLGAGELMMNDALIAIYKMQGFFKSTMPQ